MLNQMQQMAARDLAAAALAVREGCDVTALALALDAINSLTGLAVEGDADMQMLPVEVGHSGVAYVLAADVRRLDQMARDLSAAVGHVRWSVIKAMRARVK